MKTGEGATRKMMIAIERPELAAYARFITPIIDYEIVYLLVKRMSVAWRAATIGSHIFYKGYNVV